MRELITFCFNGGQKQFTVVTKFGSTWTDDKDKFKTIFDKAFLKLAIKFLFDNCFFLILVIYHFDKSLESPWVLILHFLWLIYLDITMRING